MYESIEYWEKRYANDGAEETFEWYLPYSHGIRELLAQVAKHDERILVIGCGNSTMSEEMYDDGFKNLVSTDVVPRILRRMRQRSRHREGLVFEQQDATQLTYEDASFDVVIDKGTIDAIDVGPKNVPNVVREAHRVLTPGGRFIVFSSIAPPLRDFYFQGNSLHWNISKNVIRSRLGIPCYVYVMTKERAPKTTTPTPPHP